MDFLELDGYIYPGTKNTIGSLKPMGWEHKFASQGSNTTYLSLSSHKV
jgi:hypothetical protein